jgi:hypothetical protein
MKLEFAVAFEEQPEQPVALAAYLFDRSGRLLAHEPVRDGRVVLEVKDKRSAQPTLLIAPVQADNRAPTLAALRKAGAYEPVWRLDRERDVQELLPIPADIGRLWLPCFCRVRGRVVRPITLLGFHLLIPVCHARVHICEVDRLPLLIERLPDPLIRRLRDELLPVLERPFVPPIPRPDPPPEPVLSPAVLAAAESALLPALEEVQLNPQPLPPRLTRAGHAHDEAQLNPQPLPPRLTRAGRTNSEAQLNPQPEPPVARGDLPSLTQLSVSLRSESIQSLRATLADNALLIHPLICGWPWLWPWLTCDELAVVETDEQGRFDRFIAYPCGGDRPDLYFWVEYLIDGVWTTVHRPPMRCNTYWNYACGSEVTIRVSDPRVGCRPRPLGPLVSVYGVGTQVAVEAIDANGYAPGITINNVAVPRRPFGGLLGLWADFATDPLADAGVTHYRWSYRRAGVSPDPEAGWTALTTPFARRYRADFPPANSVSKLYHFELDPAANAFRIPPEQPWLADGASGGAWDDWSLNGFATALFDTTTLPGSPAVDPEGVAANDRSGDYELKLELFRSDGARVDLGALGIDIQVQNMATAAWDDWHNVGPANRYEVGGSLAGFRMGLHIDNNPLVGEIIDVQVAGAGSGPCGFIDYPAGASATLAFRAGQLHNHAAFYFAVSRGSSGRIEVAQAMVGAATVDPIDPATSTVIDAVNRYTRGAYTFTRHAPVGQLLSAGCTRAALAEELYVYATATDGWNGRLYWMDRMVPVKAFALTPEE